MNELKVFNFEDSEIRTQIINDEPHFMLTDVCKVLDIKNVSDAKSRLKKDGVVTTDTIDNLGRRQNANFINESNLYKVIFQSRKTNAEKFTDWVTSEVLPSIRKTGGYQVPTDPMVALKLMFQATEETKEVIENVKNRVFNLEENASLSPGEYNYVSKRISQKVFQVGRDRAYNMNKKQKAELFKALNSEIAFITGVRTRSQLKNKQFDMVIDFIDDWEPSKATAVVVKQLELEVI